MAECRSSKPNAAGSNPVAHSKIKLKIINAKLFLVFNSQRRVVSIGKMSVSKTEVFSSNLNAPARVSLNGKEKRDFCNLISHILAED